MGKRELLIVGAFVLAGLVAYQVANPAPLNRRQGFSFSSFVTSLRREVRGNPASASATKSGTITVGEGVSELRLANLSRVAVSGGPGPDITYEMAVESNGPDENAARQNASSAALIQDLAGSVLSLRPTAARNVRQVVRLTLTVPASLAVRIATQGNSRLEASDVSAVHLDNVVGDVRINRVKGQVTGSHRNGDILIFGAGGVNLTLVSSKLTVETIDGGVTLNARNGPARISEVKGPLVLDLSNAEAWVVRPRGTVRVNGSGGRVSIDDPAKPVNVDVRRTNLTLTLAQPVPVTAITTDAPLHLALTGPPSIALDAVALDGGSIDARDFSLTTDTSDDQTRVKHAFGAGTAAVALRNQHGEIVISRTK